MGRIDLKRDGDLFENYIFSDWLFFFSFVGMSKNSWKISKKSWYLRQKVFFMENISRAMAIVNCN